MSDTMNKMSEILYGQLLTVLKKSKKDARRIADSWKAQVIAQKKKSPEDTLRDYMDMLSRGEDRPRAMAILIDVTLIWSSTKEGHEHWRVLKDALYEYDA